MKSNEIKTKATAKTVQNKSSKSESDNLQHSPKSEKRDTAFYRSDSELPFGNHSDMVIFLFITQQQQP